MFFLFPRLEHPAGWICARYKSLLLLLLLGVNAMVVPHRLNGNLKISDALIQTLYKTKLWA